MCYKKSFHEIILQHEVIKDYEAGLNSGEISLKIGDILTVTKHLGGTKWEGTNQHGKSGAYDVSNVIGFGVR